MIKKIIIISVALTLLTGCADVQHNINPCLEGHIYGFWGGLWHGMIAPFSWIGSLFSSDIAVWAINNNGGWYTTGFIIGIGGLTSGAYKSTSK